MRNFIGCFIETVKDCAVEFKEFIVKAVVVTLCLSFILFLFLPSLPTYYFFDSTHRCNLVTGKSESYSNASYDRGWHEHK